MSEYPDTVAKSGNPDTSESPEIKTDWAKLAFFAISGGLFAGFFCWLFYPLSAWFVPIILYPVFVAICYHMPDGVFPG